MRTRSMIVLVACALLLSLGTATAEYDPSRDVRVGVDSPTTNRLASRLRIGSLGRSAFRVQEGAHASLKALTGVSVDHFYVWICLGPECVPVDPFTVGN